MSHRLTFHVPRSTPVRLRRAHALPAVIVLIVLAVLLLALGVFPGKAHGQTGVQLDGVNDHVALGVAPSLGVSTFTVETWFRRTGLGATVSTGTGGVTAVPLLTKGRGEAEGSTVDMNWFLGFRGSDSLLVADYEEGTGQTSPGLNHPIAGTTVLQRNTWYHAAVTFDGTTLRLYLNGALEGTVVVGAGRLPQSASIQHAALGAAMNSTGVASGFFAGMLDEPRVWNVARTQSEIAAGLATEIASAPGLVGRWGLNEGAGLAAANSAGAATGTLTNGAQWAAGAPFALRYALGFNGGNVGFGDSFSLKLTTFTIETWFRRDGAGTTANTGTGGVLAVPLVTKGVGEAENPAVDLNWFLGLRGSDGVLVADFEEGATGAAPSLNHPVIGVTPIVDNQWHHAAATYDGAEWRLYLDGALEATSVVGQPPAAAGTQGAGLGAAFNSTLVPSGSFVGALDEVRVWNVARTAAEIVAAINVEMAVPEPGLVARWALDEGAGTQTFATVNPILGVLSGAVGWVAPASFAAAPPQPPAAPTGLAVEARTHVLARITWTDASNNESGFVVERSSDGPAGPFVPVDTTGANATWYDDAPLAPGADYCWRVWARNAAGASAPAGPVCATMPVEAWSALDFAPRSHVTFGAAPALGLAQFTLETWFRRDGAGADTTTGTGGVNAVPLLAKGRAESDGSTVDMNWFLGIQAGTDRLAADFEEGAGGVTPGLNHPVVGVTPITYGVWHHAAATYDGTTWQLYLDGNLEATLAVGRPPQSASIQHAALGAALSSTGAPGGAFDGALDEVRVWNVARTQAEIQSTANARITVPTAGLVARWGLDEGWGATVAGSAGTSITGTVVGAGAAWFAPGAPFDLDFNLPPSPPGLVGPPDGATGVWPPPTLAVTTADPDGDTLMVRFYGRPASPPSGPDFTVVKLPDTQYYTSQLNGGSNAMFQAQTNWIVANRVARNIVGVVQVGDCTEHGDNGGDDIEWQRADASLSILENPATTGLADGIPYGVCVGNHDQSPIGNADGTTTFYNQYFGEARFLGRGYYGGHYGGNNDNHVELFSGGGIDFVMVCLEYDTSPDALVLAWADSVLAAHPTRKAIVATHNMINSGNPATFSTQGQAIYDALRDRPNLLLLLGGHVPGEGRRADTFEGRTVHSLLADYQSRTNGGNGWLRILEFSPAQGVLRVRTYSPWLDQWEADADSSSQFTLAVDLTPSAPFALIDSIEVVAGGPASVTWPGLELETEYEWYAEADDGAARVPGPLWSFTVSPFIADAGDRVDDLALDPIQPNPAHGALEIHFALPRAGEVTVRVLDLGGREVARLAQGWHAAGRHRLEWKGSSAGGSAAPGVYFVRLERPDGHTIARRVVLLR